MILLSADAEARYFPSCEKEMYHTSFVCLSRTCLVTVGMPVLDLIRTPINFKECQQAGETCNNSNYMARMKRSILVANMVTVKALGRIAIVVIEAVLDLMV